MIDFVQLFQNSQISHCYWSVVMSSFNYKYSLEEDFMHFGFSIASSSRMDVFSMLFGKSLPFCSWLGSYSEREGGGLKELKTFFQKLIILSVEKSPWEEGKTLISQYGKALQFSRPSGKGKAKLAPLKLR